jgi:hypothetical protein
MRNAIWAVAATALIGCAEVTDGLASLGMSRDATGEGIRTLSLLGGSVRARGPEGYCIDQSASSAGRGFVVMAGCALLAGDVAVMPTLDGLITVQFGDPDTASVTDNEDAFATFLRSDAGRGLLSADGDLAAVSEVSTIADRAGVLARFEDTSAASFAGTSGPQWRGFLDVRGRLVTISVLSFERDALSRAEGERLLVVAMAELAEVNAVASPTE